MTPPMIDPDSIDAMLRDALAAAVVSDVPPSNPAQRVAARVRRRRVRRAAVRTSVAAVVCVLAVVVLASRPATRGSAPTDHQTQPTPLPAPSVLSTPQVASDRFARALLGDQQTAIDWTSVRLLDQQGKARVFGARTTRGELCNILVVPDSQGHLASGTDCGPGLESDTARASAIRFAASGSDEFIYARDTSAAAFFVPDAVRSATVDGVPVPVTRNGLLVVASAAKFPKSITLSSAKGTVTVSFKLDSDGIPNGTVSGSYE